MSTRGVIAETVGESWKGRYHHWDSYPTALGKTLWGLYHGHFKKDLPAMLKVLLEDHPAGWSTINADWNLPIGFQESKPRKPGEMINFEEPKPPQCYCHGDRKEEAHEVKPEDDSGPNGDTFFPQNPKTGVGSIRPKRL